ncbi:MAG: DegT/DnrJ/EryC1/StrS aminotransferase family protein [Desulfovibrionales bacterium]|nr:DegT/DnrJ/EryC1/StrS aminotransferase family protein [Desulfovibrionales bacterium]
MGVDAVSPWPCFTEEEANAVRRVLLSNRVNYWTGDECRKFEQEFSEWIGVRHAVAVSNGTVALDLGLMGAGLGPGDEVIVTCRTFLASVSSIVNAGARPIFADVDSDTQNITAESIREVVTPQTRAVVCVHLAGCPCDMDPIMALAEEFGLFVIEDCAQAHGAKYKGIPVGTIGHVGAWSFCQDKIMTTGGEGGMVTTNDPELWSKIWAYKDHGKSWGTVFEQLHPPGFRWVHESFGTNWRMTEMQAAIGRIQLARMADWHGKRCDNAMALLETAVAIPIFRVPRIPDWAEHGWYKCYLFVRHNRLRKGWSRNRIMKEMNDMGIPCYTGICPEVYLEKAFERTGLRPDRRLPHAKRLGEDSLMFLVHPTLTKSEIQSVCDGLISVGAAAIKLDVPSFPCSNQAARP